MFVAASMLPQLKNGISKPSVSSSLKLIEPVTLLTLLSILSSLLIYRNAAQKTWPNFQMLSLIALACLATVVQNQGHIIISYHIGSYWQRLISFQIYWIDNTHCNIIRWLICFLNSWFTIMPKNNPKLTTILFFYLRLASRLENHVTLNYYLCLQVWKITF